MKPRIFKYDGAWCCVALVMGMGDTPAEAFASWQKKRAEVQA